MRRLLIFMHGADTETNHGYCRLLCIENHPHHYTSQIGEWIEWTNYLLDAPEKICFYNLRFDVEAILKHYPEQFIKNLLYLTEAEIVFPDKIWTFKLIPWKVFTIREMVLEKTRRRTKRIVQCFDTAQFYQESLAKAALKVLGKKKLEDSEFAASLNESEEPWKKEFPRIRQYCQEDAVLSGELMRTFIESSSAQPINLSPKNPISCAWYAKELIKQCIPEIKKVKSMRTGQGYYYTRPWKRFDNVGAQCYFGGRFEPPQKGTFENVHNGDINSAYPYWISQLPNPYNLQFVKDYEPEGQWSMVKAEVWVPDDLILGPLPYRTLEAIIFPLGNWTGWFHWAELKNAEKYGIQYQIQKALNGYEPNGIERPFAKRIPDLYEKRLIWKEEDDPRQLSSKVAMNSTYGVFYEKNERIEETIETRSTEIDGHHLSKKKDNPGRFFHPYLAGWITSQTRIQLLQAIRKPEDVIFLATDGILSQSLLNIPCSKKMGEWSQTTYEKARVFGNGLYELDGKMKTRGFRKDSQRDKRPIVERMKMTPEGIVIESIEKGPIHLGQSFKLRDYSLKDALTWIEKKKETNITYCHKRIWPQFSIRDLYEKQIQSSPRKVEGGKLNRNPGLVWQGNSGNDFSIANRFILGRLQMENHS